MTTKDQIEIAEILTEMYDSSSYPDLKSAFQMAINEYGRENVKRATNPNGVVEILVRDPEEGWIVFWNENEVDEWDSTGQHFGDSLN